MGGYLKKKKNIVHGRTLFLVEIYIVVKKKIKHNKTKPRKKKVSY